MIIARPIADSEAATLNINNENTWPNKSSKKYEKKIK